MPPRRQQQPPPGPQSRGPQSSSARRVPVVRRTTPARFAAERRAAGPREKITETAPVRGTVQTLRGDPAHVVMAEFIAAVAIIGMRTIGQYEVRGKGTRRGVIVPSKGRVGPLPMLAATMIVYFLLALLAMSGGTRAKVAAVAGLIYDLGMLFNSTSELNKLTAHLADIGSGKRSPGGGPGPGELAYRSVLGSGGSYGSYYVKPGPHNKCPPGTVYDPYVKLCHPPIGSQPIQPD